MKRQVPELALLTWNVLQLAKETLGGTLPPLSTLWPAQKRKNRGEEKEQRKILLMSAVQTLQRSRTPGSH